MAELVFTMRLMASRYALPTSTKAANIPGTSARSGKCCGGGMLSGDWPFSEIAAERCAPAFVCLQMVGAVLRDLSQAQAPGG